VDRHRLGLILAGAVLLLSGCVERGTPAEPSTSDTTTTSEAPATPAGYPKPVGERLAAPPGDYPKLDMRVGDVVTVELEIAPDRAQNDESIVVYAEDLGGDKYAFQAIAPGETRIVLAEPPAGSCGDDEEEDGCTGRPAPPVLDITVTA
jgi:hypothetical protein